MANKHIISVLSHKGGGGKTLTSHYLAWGLAYAGKRVVHVTTDSVRTVKSDDNRPYRCISGKTSEELKTVIKKFLEHEDKQEKDPATGEIVVKPDLYMVIDGGANKHELDEFIAKVSDLVLTPVKYSFDDFEATLLDLKRMPNAVAIKNEWPTEYKSIPIADKEFEESFKEYIAAGRVFDSKIERSSNLKLISNDTKLSNLREVIPKSRTFAFTVINWIKTHSVS